MRAVVRSARLVPVPHCAVLAPRPCLLCGVRSLLQALGARVWVSMLLNEAPQELSLETVLLGQSLYEITR